MKQEEGEQKESIDILLSLLDRPCSARIQQ
jgi:hypothetical protein